MTIAAIESGRSRSKPPATALIVAVLFGSSFGAFHDLGFPLSLVDGSSNEWKRLALQVDEGSIWRQICIPIIGLLGLYLLARPHERRLDLWTPLGVVIVAYLCWTFASLLWSDTPELTFKRLLVFFFLSVGAIGVASLDARSIRTVFVWVTLMSFGVGLLNELVLGTFAPWDGEYRFAGTVHPNLQAASMAQLSLTGLCLAFDPQVRHRWAGPVLVVFGLVIVLLTQSRTSLVSLVMASAFVVAVWGWRCANPAVLFGAAAAVVLGATTVVLEISDPTSSPIGLVTSMLERPRDQGNIEALTGRTDVWQTCIRMAMDQLLIGVGFDSFWTPRRIAEISSLHNWGINQAHSAYIEHLVSLGLVGLGLWCLLVLGALWLAVRRYMATGAASFLWIASQVAFCMVHAFSESINMMPVFNGYVLLLLVFSLSYKPTSGRRRVKKEAAHAVGSPR
ncbi:O-antigen ligase family protein [Rhodoplanes roseus]|nr:O-antigen ligase family protein [Rhodoplanes roseus]